jgi:hypothetical protein
VRKKITVIFHWGGTSTHNEKHWFLKEEVQYTKRTIDGKNGNCFMAPHVFSAMKIMRGRKINILCGRNLGRQ